VPFEVVGKVGQQLLPLPLQGCGAGPYVVDDAAQITDEQLDESVRITDGFGGDVPRVVCGGTLRPWRPCADTPFGVIDYRYLLSDERLEVVERLAALRGTMRSGLLASSRRSARRVRRRLRRVALRSLLQRS
jgi:hypothetical protein